jgi:diacylglycerol kinase (ATP)
MPPTSGRERALILDNPQARLAQTSWRGRAVAEVEARYDVEVVTPRNTSELTRRAREAATAGVAVVVAAGGDGTVNAVAQGLCGTGTALGILPLGSANDLARELGIPRHDIAAAARLIATGCARPSDLGSVAGRMFCTVGGIALVARATLLVTRFKQRSALARHCADLLAGGIYQISATAVLLGRELDEHMHLQYREASSGEQRELEVSASALFVANRRTLGGGLVLPVETNPADGVLEICLVPARSRISLMLNFARLSARRRIPAGVLHVVRATQAIIQTTRENAFVADGELLATGRRFDVGVKAAALRVITAADPSCQGSSRTQIFR